MATQREKVEAFRKLHASGTFVIPNPWDIGSAKILASMGFRALATTSAGYAFSLGRPDGDGIIGREETLANFKTIVDATDLPVSADLQGGFGREPKEAAETIRQAAAIGLAGGSIEDATGDAAKPIYDLGLAKERVAAAVEAARKAGFVLTARAENFLWGRPDLADTIKRLQVFQDAGAEVLYAPGLKTEAEIAAVVKAVDRPVNVLMGGRTNPLTADDLARLGVRRISVGSGLYLAAMGAFHRAAQELKDKGTATFVEGAMPFVQLNTMFGGKD
ncbi:MAG TPA: isocitrate lyase/phosphoenolpyruvate mutase family protein [Candidatus Binatia bacterium]|nr:isocitrate lyase/phosphoenolpyruvate mutase family protein [Candidatus Binatia bacterium]